MRFAYVNSGRASLLRVMNNVTMTKGIVDFIWTHPANKKEQVRALLRAINFQTRGRLLHQRTLARLGDRSMVWVDLHRPAASKVLYANPPDHPEMLVWRQVLRPGDLFIDVGANIGTYTIWAGELGAEVIALEPLGIPLPCWWRTSLSTVTRLSRSRPLLDLFARSPDLQAGGIVQIASTPKAALTQQS